MGIEAGRWVVWLVVLIIAGAGIAVFVRSYNENVRAKRQQRIDAIRANQAAWGDDICEHLIQTGQAAADARVHGVLAHIDDWGEETCLQLLKRSIGTGMSAEMVKASLGEADKIDNQDVSASGRKYRWIYGVPRHGAAYIWFKDDKVVRIKQ